MIHVVISHVARRLQYGCFIHGGSVYHAFLLATLRTGMRMERFDSPAYVHASFQLGMTSLKRILGILGNQLMQ